MELEKGEGTHALALSASIGEFRGLFPEPTEGSGGKQAFCTLIEGVLHSARLRVGSGTPSTPHTPTGGTWCSGGPPSQDGSI